MGRPFSRRASRWFLSGFTFRTACALNVIGTVVCGAGCNSNQIKSLVESVRSSESPPQVVEHEAPTPLAEKPAPTDQAASTPAASAVDVDPGSGRDVALVDGYRMMPPETFNVITEEEGSDFRATYKRYRWERLSGGAWFVVNFLSGMEYEGTRMPQIQDERVVRRRIQTAFANIDEKHQLRSNGSQPEKLAGLSAVRTNVIGRVEGDDAVGHLYLLTDGKYLIEIVALATESNRSVLKICRESANSLSREPGAGQ